MISLADADRSRLMRKLMDVEIKALEDLTPGDEATFDGIVSREAAAELRYNPAGRKSPASYVPTRREVPRRHRPAARVADQDRSSKT